MIGKICGTDGERGRVRRTDRDKDRQILGRRETETVRKQRERKKTKRIGWKVLDREEKE